MPERILITPAELVDRWRGRVSEGALSVWRSRKKGPPYIKVGGKVLYDLAAIEKYEQEQTRLGKEADNGNGNTVDS